MIGAIESRFHGGYTQNSMLAEIRMEPTVLILQPESASDVLSRPRAFGRSCVRATRCGGSRRAITNRIPMIVQVAAGTEP